jgi:hypothetical protein
MDGHTRRPRSTDSWTESRLQADSPSLSALTRYFNPTYAHSTSVIDDGRHEVTRLRRGPASTEHLQLQPQRRPGLAKTQYRLPVSDPLESDGCTVNSPGVLDRTSLKHHAPVRETGWSPWCQPQFPLSTLPPKLQHKLASHKCLQGTLIAMSHTRRSVMLCRGIRGRAFWDTQPHTHVPISSGSAHVWRA